MQPTRKIALFVCSLALFLSVLACAEEGIDSNVTPPARLTNAVGYTGDGLGTGTMEYRFEPTIRCARDDASFHMMIAPDGKLPSDSYITGATPNNEQYFRLTVQWVRLPLLGGTTGHPFECNYDVDASQERVETRIEGFFQPATHVFTIYACNRPSANTPCDKQFSWIRSPDTSYAPGMERFSVDITIVVNMDEQSSYYLSTSALILARN